MNPADFGLELFQRPEWSFGARAGNVVLSEFKSPISDFRCAKCVAKPEELGERVIQFVAPASTIELVIRAQHKSSQCTAEVSDVEVEVDYVRLEEL